MVNWFNYWEESIFVREEEEGTWKQHTNLNTILFAKQHFLVPWMNSPSFCRTFQYNSLSYHTGKNENDTKNWSLILSSLTRVCVFPFPVFPFLKTISYQRLDKTGMTTGFTRDEKWMECQTTCHLTDTERHNGSVIEYSSTSSARILKNMPEEHKQLLSRLITCCCYVRKRKNCWHNVR